MKIPFPLRSSGCGALLAVPFVAIAAVLLGPSSGYGFGGWLQELAISAGLFGGMGLVIGLIGWAITRRRD